MIKLTKDLIVRSSTEEFITFKLQEKDKGIQVRYENETLWMTQKAMSELFNVEQPAIAKHLINIYNEKELDKDSTYSKMELVQKEGHRSVKRNVEFYNLDAIISVGYRVNSKKATNFRIWATKILKEYMIKGVVMDDERLKNPNYIFGEDYFEETLERIRNIRSSERRFYQKITDIYATSIDYDAHSLTTKKFFARVQNQLHWAIHGETAAEPIYRRADSEKENMGLTTWKDAPDGKIQRFDVVIAKNYLTKEELSSMARIVNAYLDLAELRAEEEVQMTMEDWAKRIDIILEAGGDAILADAGKITAEFAKEFAESEFEKYRIVQDRLFSSDFDRFNNGDNLLPFDINPDKE